MHSIKLIPPLHNDMRANSATARVGLLVSMLVLLSTYASACVSPGECQASLFQHSITASNTCDGIKVFTKQDKYNIFLTGTATWGGGSCSVDPGPSTANLSCVTSSLISINELHATGRWTSTRPRGSSNSVTLTTSFTCSFQTPDGRRGTQRQTYRDTQAWLCQF